MARENVEIVRRCCEAFDRGDYEAALDLLAPDIEKGSGVALERPTFGVWTMRNGKATRIRFYSTMAEALDAVGL